MMDKLWANSSQRLEAAAALRTVQYVLEWDQQISIPAGSKHSLSSPERLVNYSICSRLNSRRTTEDSIRSSIQPALAHFPCKQEVPIGVAWISLSSAVSPFGRLQVNPVMASTVQSIYLEYPDQYQHLLLFDHPMIQQRMWNPPSYLFHFSARDHGDDDTYIPMYHTSLCLILIPSLVLLVHKFRIGYHDFLALGPGGTPSTIPGYLRICVLSIFALKNPLKPPGLPQNLSPQIGILKFLPKRSMSRPKVAGLAPHRQITQRAPPALYAALTTAIKHLAAENQDRFYEATSCFEQHSSGLFSVPHSNNRKTCNGEICHSHPSDGSMHLTLHPADVKLVLESGWGERHPLARENWWWKFRFVPPGFVMIYAPQNLEELDTVVQIILAASWWVNGMEPRWSKASDEFPVAA
ncbi:hypothetical protein FQN57_006884 [Myotisia sp. PD_48]|nr:hypothetical protein FQN57_006884 [Myotisia sp. PD_48]